MTIRPRSTSLRTSSASRSSRLATHAISGVITPCRAASSCVIGLSLASGVISDLVPDGSGNRRLVDVVNGRIQRGVEFGIVLMDGQSFQKSPREAGHDAVVLAQ